MDEVIERQVKRINELQSVCFAEKRKLYSDERAEWNGCVWFIQGKGYTMKSKSIRDGHGRLVQVIWSAALKSEKKRIRHFSAEWKNVDMTPNDGKRNCKGNCTTRALSYCLRELFTYREIEHEQYRLAEEANRSRGVYWGDGRCKSHRNTNGIWEKVMVDMGYGWIRFRKTVRRDNLATILHEIEYPIISQSSGHVAVVEKGAVVDSWDSRHGRCTRILVKIEDLERIKVILCRNKVKCW